MGLLESEGEVYSFGTARSAQAQACPITGARQTVVFLTFSFIAQGGGAGGASKATPYHRRGSL